MSDEQPSLPGLTQRQDRDLHNHEERTRNAENLRLLRRQIELAERSAVFKDVVDRRSLRRIHVDEGDDSTLREADSLRGSKLVDEANRIIENASNLANAFRGTGHRLDPSRAETLLYEREAQLWAASSAAIRGGDLDAATQQATEVMRREQMMTTKRVEDAVAVQSSMGITDGVSSGEASSASSGTVTPAIQRPEGGTGQVIQSPEALDSEELSKSLKIHATTTPAKSSTELDTEFSATFGRPHALDEPDHVEASRTLFAAEDRVEKLRTSLGLTQRLTQAMEEVSRLRVKASRVHSTTAKMRLKLNTVGQSMGIPARMRATDLMLKKQAEAAELDERVARAEGEVERLKKWQERWDKTQDEQVLSEEAEDRKAVLAARAAEEARALEKAEEEIGKGLWKQLSGSVTRWKAGSSSLDEKGQTRSISKNEVDDELDNWEADLGLALPPSKDQAQFDQVSCLFYISLSSRGFRTRFTRRRCVKAGWW